MAANKDAAFGLKPVGTLSGAGNLMTNEYFIADDEASSMFQGDPVKQQNSNTGFIDIGDNNEADIGVLNGVFYNAATTEKPTFQNYYSQVTPANSENITAFVIDNPTQLYVGMIDTAIPIANMGKTFGFASTTGSTTSGQSTNKMLLAGGHATNNTWRTVRIAEDPENQDIAVANCSVVFVQNLNQYNNGVTMA